jgi:hypothetical protein
VNDPLGVANGSSLSAANKYFCVNPEKGAQSQPRLFFSEDSSAINLMFRLIILGVNYTADGGVVFIQLVRWST